MKKKILVVDDDRSILKLIEKILEKAGITSVLAVGGEEALRLYDDSIQAVLLDIKMPDMDGSEVLKKLKRRNSELPVIMLTAHGSIRSAVDLMKGGATDYLTKPIDRDLLLKTINNAIENYSLKKELASLKSSFTAQYHFRNVIGKSQAMQKALYLAKQVIDSDVPVLITGESGVGKEVIARAIHAASNKRDKPFIAVNCAAIPFDLLESQMFGHIKGSFTGAITDQVGKFEQARSGTILLDEISEMPLALQAKLLRVLQEREFTPLGSSKVITLDARVIATSNRIIKKVMENGEFRSDLYYRIAVMTLHIPPLRDRRQDIPLFIDHFFEKLSKKNYKCAGISPKAMDILTAYSWEGNVRQLENVITRSVLVAGDGLIDVEHLPDEVINPTIEEDAGHPQPITNPDGIMFSREEMEKQMIENALKIHNGNISKAAKELKMGRTTVYRKMKKFGIDYS